MVKIRLKRLGATKRPFYRVVVADSRSPRDGRFIEQIGKYHPMEDPSFIEIEADRALYWLREGAQPTSQVRNLLKIQGVWETFESGRSSAKAPVKAKAAAAKGAAAKKSASKPAGTGAEQAETTSAPAEA
jgi:small subunit ribosomal protein S16